MQPPQKDAGTGEVDIHASFTPISAPLTFVSDDVACCAVGSSVCLWNVREDTREYIHTSSHSISKLCGNPTHGLVAFCEGGTNPKAFVYTVTPRKLLLTLSNLTELELADMTFSKCGTRLYALSRATSKRLQVFSTTSGAVLPGCDLALPQRFDKVSVFPGHKDRVALIRSSTVRIVTIQKSYETYIVRLLPSPIPADADLAISAYAWTPSGTFVFATRQGAMVTLDGMTGAVLHACQANEPISSVAPCGRYLLTAHLGNVLKVWTQNEQEALTAEVGQAMLQEMPPMEGGISSGQTAYVLEQSIELDSIGASTEVPLDRLQGQVAYLQITPAQASIVMTTAEGEVWALEVPHGDAQGVEATQADDEDAAGDGSGERGEVRAAASRKIVSFDNLAIEDMQLRSLSWFHTHPISDSLFLGPSGRVCASCDESGRIRLWDLSKAPDMAKGFRTLSFTSSVTSMTADYEGQVLLVGCDSGCVHLVRVPHWSKAYIADTIRLSDSGVSKIVSVTHESGVLVVGVSFFNHKLAFLTVALESPQLLMMGFRETCFAIEDISFVKAEFEGEDPKLLVVGLNGEASPCMWMIAAPPLDYQASIADLTAEDCPVWGMKLGVGGKARHKPTAVASISHDCIAVGFATGAVNIYTQPTSFGMATAKLQVTEATEALTAHTQLVTRLNVSDDGRYLLSASMDGAIWLTTIEEGQRKLDMQKSLHNPYNGGVTQACLDVSGEMVLSTGGSDGVIVWSDPAAKITPPEVGAEGDVEEASIGEENAVFHVDDRDMEAYPLWQPISFEEREAKLVEEQDDPELNALALAQRRALMLEVEALRKKLRMLVEQNNACSDLERLDRSDFCVDTEERDQIAAKTKERCDALRAQIEKENVARQLIRDRLIKEFWDPMRSKGCQITSLSTNLAVSNYPERIVSDEEQTTLRKLRILRQAEQMEDELVKSTSCPKHLKDDILLKADEFATGEEGYIVNWWHAGVVAQKGEKAFTDQKFLYEPFELLSNSRRRLQIHLLQALAAEYRQAFNELFKQCQSDKQGIMDQIKDKVRRIRAILGELQIEEKVPEPMWHDHEDEQAVLGVKDHEILANKWISPEELAAREEARKKEEERLRQLRENDAGTRALNQMMGGTLKTKKDLSALEITLDKEPWMDEIPEEEMSDVQFAALKEFREKEKALADEQEKYRKQLDAELRKLRSEIQDLTEQFEKVLKELHHQRFAHDAKFFCQELYCVRLQLALMQSIEDEHVLKQSTQDVEEARAKLQEAETKLDAFTSEVAAKKMKQDDRMRHEREVASAQHFRQQFAMSGLEPEAIGALLQLFRKRKPAAAVPAPGAGEQEGTEGGGSDLYADLGALESPSAHTMSQEEDIALECPEGIDEASFQRMLELRRERLAAEIEVQNGAAELQEMQGLHSYFQRERDVAAQAHRQLEQELKEHMDLMRREEYDIEILFKLKQGQVEVPQAAVVTDYSDAIVIGNDVVESRNDRILELGKEKVSTLETIKEFRKKLSLIQWEYKMLQMQTTDLEERTKDVHMLRVTKGLQSLLKGGEEGRNKADADLLERKIEHLNSTLAQKEGSLKKQYAAGAQATKLRKMENSMLEKKLRELQQNVIQREHIRRLRAPQGGAPQGSKEKGEKPKIIGGGGRIEENEAMIKAAQSGFGELRVRQRLMDAAKRHTEEIDLLTKELDRLRQKTFPSFVHLHEERGNPDHR